MKLLTHALLKQNVWAWYLVTDHGQWPQWSGWRGGKMLVMLMDAACCLPHLQAHSLRIHSASQIDFSCPLFKLPPTPPASEGAEICWGTSIKPVEALLFISDWIHKFVLPQSSCSELTSSSWIHEFGRKWTKGTEEPNFELNCGMLSLIFITNVRKKITELWKGPAHCWIGTSAPGINHFKNLTQKRINVQPEMYTCFSNILVYSSICQ